MVRSILAEDFKFEAGSGVLSFGGGKTSYGHMSRFCICARIDERSFDVGFVRLFRGWNLETEARERR